MEVEVDNGQTVDVITGGIDEEGGRFVVVTGAAWRQDLSIMGLFFLFAGRMRARELHAILNILFDDVAPPALLLLEPAADTKN